MIQPLMRLHRHVPVVRSAVEHLQRRPRWVYAPRGGWDWGGLNIQYSPENGMLYGSVATAFKAVAVQDGSGATIVAYGFTSGHRTTRGTRYRRCRRGWEARCRASLPGPEARVAARKPADSVTVPVEPVHGGQPGRQDHRQCDAGNRSRQTVLLLGWQQAGRQQQQGNRSAERRVGK